MDAALRLAGENVITPHFHLFQSLFYWMPPCDYAVLYDRRADFCVSILVLVDAALRQYIKDPVKFHNLVFQSLF